MQGMASETADAAVVAEARRCGPRSDCRGPGGSGVDIADVAASISEIHTIFVTMRTVNSQAICQKRANLGVSSPHHRIARQPMRLQSPNPTHIFAAIPATLRGGVTDRSALYCPGKRSCGLGRTAMRSHES